MGDTTLLRVASTVALITLLIIALVLALCGII